MSPYQSQCTIDLSSNAEQPPQTLSSKDYPVWSVLRQIQLGQLVCVKDNNNNTGLFTPEYIEFVNFPEASILYKNNEDPILTILIAKCENLDTAKSWYEILAIYFGLNGLERKNLSQLSAEAGVKMQSFSEKKNKALQYLGVLDFVKEYIES